MFVTTCRLMVTQKSHHTSTSMQHPCNFLGAFYAMLFPQISKRLLSTSLPRKMIIKPVPCLKDNYAYLLLDPQANQAAVVDPVEPNKVLAALAEYPEYKLSAILTTHHHADHAGGNLQLLKEFPDLPCYGGSDKVSGANHIVGHKESVKVGSLEVVPLSTPCHTMDHTCYYISDNGKQAVFTGDCIFSSGCGRFFEGTAEDMWKSIRTVAELPDSTSMYFGHEYTVSNLRFAEHIESDNKEIKEKMAWAQRVGCTTPSTIQNEKLTNPFFRVEQNSVQERVLGKGNKASAEEVLGKIRQMKDSF
ncbi:hydroxyacylglutathione hydrolase [Zychaea mexicana]|uniref:hydroxyacylglutathione hydrolase n=1 Tax=Zychaea mexicana TaxID=64656 RepID=UPI0022FEB35C|nr:hydroxyacylglutathione hydrolase [Zychaea mexicana]KAI9490910.1 hydroxyacylglutathione hydrolase [Zychaea mexicana]